MDEFFTVSLGGMATVLNTSGSPLSPGDLVEWSFFTEKGTSQGKRQKSGPRRIGVQLCSISSPRLIGRVLTFASAAPPATLTLQTLILPPSSHPHVSTYRKAGEPFDLLIKQ